MCYICVNELNKAGIEYKTMLKSTPCVNTLILGSDSHGVRSAFSFCPQM